MDRRRPSPLCIGLGALALMLGCSNQNGAGGSGTGGESTSSGSGGRPSGSGGSGTGGASTGTGGSVSGTGGVGTGGTTSTGGATGTGGSGGGGKAGASGSGGGGGKAAASGSGGNGGKAGAAATGGASATGGSPGSGGVAGSPGGSSACGTGAENANVTVTCPTGQTIDKITFASFGTPTGSCGSFATGSCDASSSMAVVQALCVGRNSCSVPANNGAFTDPCDKTTKSLSIQATCTVGGGMEPPTAGQLPFKGFAGDPAACADMQHLGVSWYYNWKQTPTTGCSSTGVPFVPMIWGHTGSEQSASGITSAVTSFVGKSYGYVLGFNEPDNSTQSNITVATAVSLWPSFNNSAIQLGTPATQANSTGQTWFTSFMGSVNGSTTLHADFIALHWYGWNAGSCDAAASQLESYIKYAEGFSGNRPIWLTEWGCLNDSAPDAPTVLAFYDGALAVFARHPRVARYSWYPWSTNLELVNSDGSLTALGVAYAAAPAYK
jgi:hypothetical protein